MSTENGFDQLRLGFVHKTARNSRAAVRGARPKQQRRQVAALNHLRLAGRHGLTRHELAYRLRIPLQSICSVARALLDSGQAIEAGNRTTQFGSRAAVLKLPQYNESANADMSNCR